MLKFIIINEEKKLRKQQSELNNQKRIEEFKQKGILDEEKIRRNNDRQF